LVGARTPYAPTKVGLYQVPSALVGANLGWHTHAVCADQGRPLPGPVRLGRCQPWLAHAHRMRRPRLYPRI